jgi:hypothetical protein
MSGKCVDIHGFIETPGGSLAEGGALHVHCG